MSRFGRSGPDNVIGDHRVVFGGPHYGPENMIMMSRDRMAFGGPQVRADLFLGGYVIYVSTGEPFRLTINDASCEKRFVAIVPPYTRHSVAGPQTLRSLLIEAETVSADLLQDKRFHSNGKESQAWAMRIEEGFQRWRDGAYDFDAESFDLFFFGEHLPCRELDGRIVRTIDRIRTVIDDCNISTAALAGEMALSPSRLRHLFGEQVGVPIRSFRAWKRLRNAIQIALQESNILKLAMAAGYADATHFCHSIKLYCGEQPSWVCAHWREATFVRTNRGEPEPALRAANGVTGRPSTRSRSTARRRHSRPARTADLARPAR